VLIKRPAANEPLGEILPADPRGHDALANALRDFSSEYADLENLRLKIKVFRIDRKEDSLRSHQTVEVFGESETGLIEENLSWIADWEANADGDDPKLKSLVVKDYERAERDGKVMFSDCTESVMGASEGYQQQLLQGFNHWLEEAQFQEFYALPSNPGVAVGDVNNDGLEDLFICQEIGLPNLLFLQQPDGSVKDVSKESGLDLLQNCRTALIVDWNNDGFNDIALAVTGGVVIASGDGSAKFHVETVIDSSEDVMVLSAADYDLDGRLDLFAGVYWADLADWQNNEVPVAGFGGAINATDGGQNGLFRNRVADGNWSFEDVTIETGMNEDNFRYSQAAAWEDFDNDGDPDLYIANDFGFNNFYRNDLQEDGSRKFTDITWQSGVQDQAAGMSAAWGDYDRDGWMDLYVSNMYSYAGNRITFQEEFKSEKDSDTKSSYQRFARGNTFFRNPGKPNDEGIFNFEDLSLQVGVNRARWAWGSRFIDLNNDGWEDFVVANGFITTAGGGDL
ncbi:MAG: FG-GAP repeat domain-containing protein, partial [Pirellulaceae bacterium]